MAEVNDGPGHARRAREEAEDDEPREEDRENVGGPNPRVREPFCVPIQIRRSNRRHIHFPISFFSFFEYFFFLDERN